MSLLVPTINLNATTRSFSPVQQEETFMNANPWVLSHYEPNPVSGQSYLRVVIRETEYEYDWGSSEVVASNEYILYFKDDDEGLPYHLKLAWTEKINDTTTSTFEVLRLSTVWAHPDEPFDQAPFHKY